MGSRTCQPALCSDGIDNDRDGKTDFPIDPGCADPGDDDETDPATAARCAANTMDDDTDGQTDFPATSAASSAGGHERGVLHRRDGRDRADHDEDDDRHDSQQVERPTR